MANKKSKYTGTPLDKTRKSKRSGYRFKTDDLLHSTSKSKRDLGEELYYKTPTNKDYNNPNLASRIYYENRADKTHSDDNLRVKLGDGGTTEKKYWIQDAIKNNGGLKRTALRMGLIRSKSEKLSKTDLHKLEDKGGKTGKRAYLAETLGRFDNGGKACDEAVDTQSLIFDKKYFTKAEAKQWAKENYYVSGDVDEKESTYHLRQEDPSKFKDDSFRTVTLKKGIKMVIACPLKNKK